MFKREFIRSLGAQIARKLVNRYLIRQCSWCKSYLSFYSVTLAYFYPDLLDKHTTHGICPACDIKLHQEMELIKERNQHV